MKKKVKTYCGNAPDIKRGWERIGVCRDSDDTEWLIFKKTPPDPSSGWKNYKVVANSEARHKANFWLSRNHKECRFACNIDYGIMHNKRPYLCMQINEFLSRFDET
ncbi:MAG: hypothetical protein G8237_06665 [Magnetococcales bacterium]|nr:hypothetical protein [Magnetococcales bacterium]